MNTPQRRNTTLRQETQNTEKAKVGQVGNTMNNHKATKTQPKTANQTQQETQRPKTVTAHLTNTAIGKQN